MRRLVVGLMAMILTAGAWAQTAQRGAEMQTGDQKEIFSDLVADVVYFRPSQQWSGFYDDMYGIEAQYRLWFGANPFGLAASIGWMKANAREESANLIDPSLGSFSGSADMTPIGASALWKFVEGESWRVNLEAGLRYVLINSDVEMKRYDLGITEQVEMENAWTGVLGFDVDWLLTEYFALFAGAGVQVDISPGEMSTKSEWLYDNNLKGYSFKLGGKFLF